MLFTCASRFALLAALAASSSAFAPSAPTKPALTTTAQRHGPPSSSALSAIERSDLSEKHQDLIQNARNVAVGAAFAFGLLVSPGLSFADGSTKEFSLPPIDTTDPNRCKFVGSKMGQANAARDKLYDLRQCKLSGAAAQNIDLSGVIMSQTDVSNAKFSESYFSKAYLRDSNFEGADFTNAIVDRATFGGSSVKNAIFANAVLTGTSFENANVEGADFSDAYMGDFDIRSLCKNPTLKGENPTTGVDTRLSAGCGLK